MIKMKNIASLLGLVLGSIFIVISCAKTDNDNNPVLDAKAGIVFQGVDDMVSLAKEHIEEISVEEFHQILNSEEYFLIDLRTESEHNSGFIPSSINITRGLLEFQIAKESTWAKAGMYVPTHNDLLIVYCKSGKRAALAAETLERMGYTNVKSIEGGWEKWKNTYPELFEKNIPSGETHKEEGGGC